MARTWPALLVGLLIAFAPASAHAALYCVAESSCVGGTNVGSDASALASALSTAQATSVPDEIDVGPGTFSTAGGFSYSTGTASNTLTLKGAGIGQTIIGSSTTGTALLVVSAGSQVSDVTVVLGPSASATGLTLIGSGAQALRVAAIGQAGTSSGTGVSLGTGATLSGASVTSTGSQMTWAILGSGTVLDTSVDATSATYGIYGPTEIHRVTVRAGICIYANGSASYKVDDALLFPYSSGNSGLIAANTASVDTVTTADHVTVVGPGDGTSVGFMAQSTAGGSPHNAKLILRSSIARGTGHSLKVWASNGAANVEVDHSDYDPATIASTISGGGSGAVTDKGGNLNVDPLFAGASDFHLQASSPVIDAGATAVQSGESVTDRDGAPRAVDGNGDGVVATDMGAYEYQPPAPPSLGGPPPGGGGATTHSVALKLASRRLAVDRRGRGKLGFRCAATGTTCRVSGRLTALVTKSTKRRSVTVGKVSGSGRAGGKASLSVRLNARGRRALAHSHKLRVRLVATVRGSDGANATLNVPLSVVAKSKRR